MFKRKYVPEHGDHEPSWEITGMQYDAPIKELTLYQMKKLPRHIFERLSRGETHITQICRAKTAQDLECGRVQTVHETGRANVPGRFWPGLEKD